MKQSNKLITEKDYMTIGQQSLTKIATQTTTTQDQIQLILLGRRHSIRNTIKDGGKNAEALVIKNLNLSILPLANTYTGANFSNPPTQEQILTIQECSKFIIEMFPMIGLQELRLAFSMAAAGKFENLNLETYYGKFSVQFLGKMLKAYLAKRKAVIAKIEHQLSLESSKQDKKETIKKNEEAKQAVIVKYNEVLAAFKQDGRIDALEVEILPYWGKILVDAKIINFTHDIKKEIVEEAKARAKKELSKEIDFGANQKPAHKRTLRGILEDVVKGSNNESFNDRWKAIYAKLIVIKSILNS